MQHASALGNSPVPRYLQLVELFRQQIARGVWKVGDRLPSNDELARSYEVARGTVRQAVQLLEREQLIEARQGRGSFVMGSVKEDRWVRMESSLEELAKVYRRTRPEMLTLREAVEAAPLRASDGVPAASYVQMRRVHRRDDDAYCLIDIHLDERLFRRSPKRFRTEAVIPILTAMRPSPIATARQTLTLAGAGLEAAEHLRIPVGSPVAHVRRVFTGAGGQVIYLAEVTYRGDVIQLEMDLKIQHQGEETRATRS